MVRKKRVIEPKGLGYGLDLEELGRIKAERCLRFIKCLKHTISPWHGVQFNILPWQEKFVRDVFGTLRPDGYRRYSKIYLEIPKKNGKTEFIAAIGLYLLCADDERGAQLYSAATDIEQAAMTYDIAGIMRDQNPTLRKVIKSNATAKLFRYHKTHSYWKVLSKVPHSKHGFNPHGILFDELHAQPNRELWDVLTVASTDARAQPLIISMTTAGWDRQSICWEQHCYAEKVAQDQSFDPTYYSMMYCLDAKEDWQDEGNWYKVNPSLGHIISIDKVRNHYREVINNPAQQNMFRRMRLNQWTEQENRRFDYNLWRAQPPRRPLEELKGRVCYGGFDLSAIKDFTALVLVFDRDGSPIVDILTFVWCPEKRLTDIENTYRYKYQEWKMMGHLKTCPGETIDYDQVRADVIELGRMYRIKDLNVDRLFQGWDTITKLDKEMKGTSVFPMGQGFMSYAMPMKFFEKLLEDHCIAHGGHPVLEFCYDNVATEKDAAGNEKPSKAQSQGKIDCFVGLVMALDRLYRRKPRHSVYSERGITTIGGN